MCPCSSSALSVSSSFGFVHEFTTFSMGIPHCKTFRTTPSVLILVAFILHLAGYGTDIRDYSSDHFQIS